MLAALAQLRRDGFESPEIDRLQQEAEQAAAKAQVERHTQQRLGEAEAVLTREELTSAEQQIDATLALEPDDQRAQVAEALDVQRAADVRQQQLAQQLDKARQLLTAQHYEEVLDALTQLRDHGFSAPEIDDLQQEAEQAAAQAQVERAVSTSLRQPDLAFTVATPRC